MRWLLLAAFLVGSVFGCRNVTGEWKNGKGSILTLVQKEHHLHGTFRTAVETTIGSAGDGASHIRGYIHDEMITFSVKYPKSVAAFTGQCFEERSKFSTSQVLHVTWLIHTKQDSCEDAWMATRTGSDRFVRASNSQHRPRDM